MEPSILIPTFKASPPYLLPSIPSKFFQIYDTAVGGSKFVMDGNFYTNQSRIVIPVRSPILTDPHYAIKTRVHGFYTLAFMSKVTSFVILR